VNPIIHACDVNGEIKVFWHMPESSPNCVVCAKKMVDEIVKVCHVMMKHPDIRKVFFPNENIIPMTVPLSFAPRHFNCIECGQYGVPNANFTCSECMLRKEGKYP